MKSNKTRYIVLTIVGLIVIVGVTALHIIEEHKSSTYESITINKDTGQEIITLPNQGPEKQGNSMVTILGANKLLNGSMTEAQFTLSEQLLNQYAQSKLGGKYQQFSILNSGYKDTGNEITGEMRLGSSSTLVNLAISYSNLTNVEVKISSTNTGYDFDSGQQSTNSQP